MASTISPSLRLRANSTRQRDLRLVSSGGAGDLAVAGKTAVIACLTGGSCDNAKVLHKASAAARERDGEFYAVLIDSPRTRLGKAQVRTLIEDAILASSLGAKIVWFDTFDVVRELLHFAQKARIGKIFVGRERPTLFSGLSRPTVYRDLLRCTKDIQIDVVGFDTDSSETARNRGVPDGI